MSHHNLVVISFSLADKWLFWLPFNVCMVLVSGNAQGCDCCLCYCIRTPQVEFLAQVLSAPLCDWQLSLQAAHYAASTKRPTLQSRLCCKCVMRRMWGAHLLGTLADASVHFCFFIRQQAFSIWGCAALSSFLVQISVCLFIAKRNSFWL